MSDGAILSLVAGIGFGLLFAAVLLKALANAASDKDERGPNEQLDQSSGIYDWQGSPDEGKSYFLAEISEDGKQAL